MAGKKNGGPPRASAPTKKSGRREITVVCFVIMPDGRTVPVEELTEEERAEWHRRQLERLSEDMSDYFTQHPEEYRDFCRYLDSQAAG